MTGRWPVRPADRPTRRETGGAQRRMRCPSSPVPPAGGVPIPRRRQPPPTHCGASRRNGRDLIIATRPAHQPLPSLLSAAAAQGLFRAPARALSLSPMGIVSPPAQAFLCLRRPHFFQQRKKWGKERRQKLRFCTSSARYTALVCKAAPPRNRHFRRKVNSFFDILPHEIGKNGGLMRENHALI